MRKAELELLQVHRIFQRYEHWQRADRAASRRLGYRQKEAIGEYFYVTELVPGIAFKTRGDAVEAARRERRERNEHD